VILHRTTADEDLHETKLLQPNPIRVTRGEADPRAGVTDDRLQPAPGCQEVGVVSASVRRSPGNPQPREMGR